MIFQYYLCKKYVKYLITCIYLKKKYVYVINYVTAFFYLIFNFYIHMYLLKQINSSTIYCLYSNSDAYKSIS